VPVKVNVARLPAVDRERRMAPLLTLALFVNQVP